MREFLDELKRRNVLRVAVGYLAAAWLVIQILETIFPVFGLPDVYLRRVIIGLAILFLPVLVLSWTFEWSPSGIERQRDVDRSGARAGHGPRTFDRVVISVLSIAVLYFAVDKFLLPSIGDGTAPPASIAVMPFADLTPGQDKAYFGDGLAEDLLDMLARNPALRVAARTSSFSFRNAELPIGEIAARLGVTHVLEGSIRSVGDHAEISVRLISGENGFNVWADGFDGDMAEIFTIRRDILARIEEALGVADSTVAGRGRTPDPEAYVIALRANYLSRESNRESMARAVDLYIRALEVDSGFALAWANLATTYINQSINGYIGWEEGYRRARDAALESVTIDTGNGTGYKALSFIARYFEGDMPLAIANMQRALDANPTSDAILADAAVLLVSLGRVDDAIRLGEYLARRSPLDTIGFWNLALWYRYADRLEESEAAFRRVHELNPARSEYHYHLGETVLLAGRHDEALELFEEESDESYSLKGRALAHFALGQQEASEAALAALIEKFGDQWPSEIAHVYAYRGELDQAFAWLDREFEKYGPGGWGEWQLQRLYDNLRDDPRWLAFLERTGTAPRQLAGLKLDLPQSIY